MADIDTLVDRIAFASLKGLSLSDAQQLLQLFGSERQVLTMSQSALYAALGRNVKTLSDEARAQALCEARREAQFVDSHHCRSLYFTDAQYPQRLLECPDAPLMLYTVGNCNLNCGKVISIVGTRRATATGVHWIESLVKRLAADIDDCIIVSGLAYGIDVAAHKASLTYGIPTVGVLAHGLTTIYPAQHCDIAAHMVRDGGMLITDYRSDARIHRGNFLARNRIVAGLCDVLIVVESAAKGGALVTARFANDYNREVMAVPGRPGDIYSAGCNRLIANNMAQLVTSADDLIDLMGWSKRPADGEQQALPLVVDAGQQRLVDYVANHPDATANRIASDLELPIGDVLSQMVELEFNGVLFALPGGRYRLS